MTYAQYKRLKPKYKRRIIMVIVIALALFVGLLYLISAIVGVVKVKLNTTNLKTFTASNVLEKEGMAKILEVMKQNKSENVLVMDSNVIMRWDGEDAAEGQPKAAVISLEVNMTNLVDQNTSEEWRLVANEKKATLRRVSQTYEGRETLRIRKVKLQTYYPALSRLTSVQLLDYLEKNLPAGNGGLYTFTDNFEHNLDPEFATYLKETAAKPALLGIWVSKIGAVSEISENYKRISECAPMVVTVEAVNEQKSKGKRVVRLPPEEKLIALLEAAPY